MLAFWLLAPPLAAQQTDVFLDDLLPRSALSSSQDRSVSPLTTVLRAPAGRTEIMTGLQTRYTGLGPYALHSQKVVVDVRQPTGIGGVQTDIRLVHRMNSRMDFGEGALRPEGPLGFEAGIAGQRSSRIGRWALRFSGGWNGGGLWEGSLAGTSAYHRIAASKWRRTDQGFHLSLPTAEVDGTSRTSSDGTGASAEIRWPDGRLQGTSLGLEWTRESYEPSDESGAVGLGALIPLTRESTALRARLRFFQSVMVSLSHRRARSNADGALSQNNQRAGRLFYGRLDSEAWSVAFSDPGAERRWRGTISRGSSHGSLSARLETWPFHDVWDQLGATAYRIRGDVESRWTAVSFDRDPDATEGWSAGLGRAHIELDGEDWLVTSLGFGRTDQRSVDDFRVGVLLVGGELRFGIPSPTGLAVVHVGGSTPIHADWDRPSDDDSSGPGWAGGWRRWANVNLGISWSLDR